MTTPEKGSVPLPELSLRQRLAAPPRLPRRRRIQDLLLHPAVWVLLAVIVGNFLGSQAGGISQRYAKLAVGLFFIFVIFRYPTYIGAGIFLVLYAFPTTIQLGDTNVIFTILLAVAWMIRVGLGKELRPHRTYLDWAIVAYVAVHILSFVNISTPVALSRSLIAIRHLFVPIILYYTIVHVGHSERRLLFLSRMFTVSIAFLYFTAFMERFAPGLEFIPQWYVTALGAEQLFAEGVRHRIGGVLTHALMGDLAAIGCVHQMYLAIRAKGKPLWRIGHWFLVLVSVYIVSLTGNRGALIAMLGGLFYFFWIFGGEISLKRVLVGLTIFFALLMVGEKTLGRFEGNVTLLTRMAGTYVERGVPDTRRQAWAYAWDLIRERPFLGHGPYFGHEEASPGGKAVWPHNAFLYYFFSIGLVGLPCYLLLLWRVWRRTWAGKRLKVGGISLARGLTAVWHIALVQFIIGQMRTDHQRGDVYVYLMWIIFAFGILARELWEEERRKGAGGRAEPVRG
ncbi:MAG: O-antigen ligase family protein [Candidatus Eisenbacteria sp.]|nr:O-antigen ligase family protein [Candidatus Eisenbacteria bacterium]